MCGASDHLTALYDAPRLEATRPWGPEDIITLRRGYWYGGGHPRFAPGRLARPLLLSVVFLLPQRRLPLAPPSSLARFRCGREHSSSGWEIAAHLGRIG